MLIRCENELAIIEALKFLEENGLKHPSSVQELFDNCRSVFIFHILLNLHNEAFTNPRYT